MPDRPPPPPPSIRRQAPPPTERSAETLLWIGDLLTKMRDARFFGELVIKINNGTIVQVEKMESLRPPKGPDG